jgi:hypothetical protein
VPILSNWGWEVIFSGQLQRLRGPALSRDSLHARSIKGPFSHWRVRHFLQNGGPARGDLIPPGAIFPARLDQERRLVGRVAIHNFLWRVAEESMRGRLRGGARAEGDRG